MNVYIKGLFLAILAACCMSLVYYIGFISGMDYTIENSRIYTDDNYIYIDVCGQLYAHDR